MDQTKIGAFLRELRKGKNLTQEQLAEKMNVSSRTVSRWETGSNMPDISLLIELADFYETDIREILNGERKSEMMTEETREVLTKVVEYTDVEKKKLLRNIMINSVCTLVCLVLLFENTLHSPGLSEGNSFYGFLLELGGSAALILTVSTIWDILKINGNMGKKADKKIRKILCIGGIAVGILCALLIIVSFIS